MFVVLDEMVIGVLLVVCDFGFSVLEELLIVGIDGYEFGEFFCFMIVD